MKRLHALNTRGGLILSFGIATIACASLLPAQVTITTVHDAAFVGPGGNVHAACYVPVADKFLASFGGTAIDIISADGSATDDGNLDLTGTSVSGLGFFALVAGTDGVIYGWEAGAGALWRWSNTGAAPTLAATGVAFARSGHVIGTGTSTKVVLTGSANGGPTQVWGTSDGLAFTLEETIPAGVPGSKSGMAINATLDQLWGVGDSGQPILKGVKSGTWATDVAFTTPNTCGPLVYDNVNQILFGFPVSGGGATLRAFNPNDATELATATTTATISTTPGYCGAFVDSTAGSGTVWIAGRNTTATSAIVAKFTFTAPVVSAVGDWRILE